ncbi:hypothetical protein ACX3T3_03890 [Actinotignum schaalii]|uniref:hypothetical protein n=1 Tax=Actinotignum TaxID=1653174 RepID=UPI00237DF9B5|nr:hypothetical protein [Actinotignum sanguinis]MDE1552244.1 hypothetical protein [Actinotignum sanguinis]MDE1643203.1 hypothetical protein [Actinotignum sanguinis]
MAKTRTFEEAIAFIRARVQAEETIGTLAETIAQLRGNTRGNYPSCVDTEKLYAAQKDLAAIREYQARLATQLDNLEAKLNRLLEKEN